MGRKERIEEQALIGLIKDHKRKVRDSLRESLFKEREERHKKEEVFYKGLWVPKDKIQYIQKKFNRKGLIIFLEIHALVLVLLLFNYFFWIVFKKFLLP